MSYTGVDEGLDKLASKNWGTDSIDMQAEPIHGDIFTDMADRIRQRDNDDLYQINRDSVRRKTWVEDLKRSSSPLFTRPISQVLAAGDFATSVGARGGDVFAAGTTSGQRDIRDAVGMNVALTLLFAPSAQSSTSKPGSSQPDKGSAADSIANSEMQKEFKPIEFPSRDEVAAVNEIKDRMESITGKNNLQQYDSLTDLEKSLNRGSDKIRLARIKKSLEEVFNRLNSANERIHDPREKVNILNVLGKSLGTNDSGALEQAYDRLQELSLQALERFDLFRDFDYNKVIFFQRIDKRNPFSEEERNAPTSAFVNLKDRGRLMINLEGPDGGVHKLSDTEAGQGYNVELVDSIMNQITRLTDNTQDFADIKREETKDGFSLGTAETALSQFVWSKPGDATCRRVFGMIPAGYPSDFSVKDILGIKDQRFVTDDMRKKAVLKLNDPDSEYYHRKTGIEKDQPVTEYDRENVRKGIRWTYPYSDRPEEDIRRGRFPNRSPQGRNR